MTQKQYEEFLTIPMPDFKVKIYPNDFVEWSEQYRKVSVVITGSINPNNEIKGDFEFIGVRENPWHYSCVSRAIENAFTGLMDDQYIDNLREKLSTSFSDYLAEPNGFYVQGITSKKCCRCRMDKMEKYLNPFPSSFQPRNWYRCLNENCEFQYMIWPNHNISILEESKLRILN